MNNILAVDVGGTHYRVGLFDREGRRLLVSEEETERAGGRDWMLGQLRERCQGLLDKTDYPVKACGVSFGGPVDFDRQQVTSIHAGGWDGFELARWFQETFGFPCRVDNDANAGALGEYRFGAGRGARSVVYVTVSTGLGSGIICDGKVMHGKDSMAGELGHVPVSDSGVPCFCGAKGCLETFTSGAAMAARGREWAHRRPEAVARMVELSGGDPEAITAKGVMQAASEGDVAATNIIRESARWLARGLMMIIRLINPDRIILGGGVAQAGMGILNPVRAYLDEWKSPIIRHTTQIVLAELGNYSPLYGAAAMGLELL